MVAIVALMTSFCACSEDDSKPDAPTITAPAITDVQVGQPADISFAVTVPGGYKSATVTATGGSATKKSEPAVGDKSGSVVVTFTAGATAGAGSASVTVTDNNNKTSNQTAVVNVTTTPAPPANEVLSGVLANKTLTNDRIWELAGRVIVPTGVTLEIEEGTIIKGREGLGALASALIIARGGKIMAEGTEGEPIIFTSILDNIAVGQTAGTNLDETDNEKWGGLIVLGKAKISAGDGDTEASIEGLPADEDYGKYGGTDDADNSGILKYVSIRHGGTLIGEGNEINGLTLGGVGTGTVLENIEVYATLDDGIEFFGGSVNVKNLLVYWQGDDGVDLDQNWSGTLDNFVVSHGAGVGTDEGLEIDGPENSTYKDGLFTLKNGTLYSDGGADGSAADIKADAQGTLQNIIMSGYVSGKDKFKFEGEYSVGDCSDHSAKVYTDALQNLLIGKFVITGSKYGSIDVYSRATNNVPNCATIPAKDKTDAAAKATIDAAAIGADETVFDWTLTAEKGKL
jgi:hypothetical protein